MSGVGGLSETRGHVRLPLRNGHAASRGATRWLLHFNFLPRSSVAFACCEDTNTATATAAPPLHYVSRNGATSSADVDAAVGASARFGG